MRSHYCGQLNTDLVDQTVTLCGWVNKRRDLGGLIFIDMRDRTGLVQVVFDPDQQELFATANKLRQEFCIRLVGTVRARPDHQVNATMATGAVEVMASELEIISRAEPLPIDFNQQVSEEQRLRYRYLDLRRPQMSHNLQFRAKVISNVRRFLDQQGFLDIETPMLTRATPEGARDYLVPSRMNQGEFYALPQSPQLFKQLLMVSGFDRYFQIVKCFRDEDLRADRQPEFTQIDCEMSFVNQEDVLNTFEGLTKHLFKNIKDIDLPDFPRISYADAMRLYGSDKLDTRFDMTFTEIKDLTTGQGFGVFDSAEYVGAICAEGCASYTRKQVDELTDFVKRPQIGAQGLIYVRYNEDGTIKSSVDKFYSEEILKTWIERCDAKPGDLLLVLGGDTEKTQKQLGELRLEMGNRLELRDKNNYKCLWVVDFPLLEKDEELGRYFAKHHPFTSHTPEDIPLLDSDPEAVRANAFDMVIHGVEIGGGSIRIHDSGLQKKMFSVLGFTEEQAESQFGFLMNAFQYGAPPHGGITFALDIFVSIFAGLDSIRDTIAFPRNTAGRDVMIDAPSSVEKEQLDELGIALKSIQKDNDSTEK